MSEAATPATKPVVELVGVGKTFKQRRGEPFRALDGIDLALHAGQVHGLLGRNGAGKSTLVKLICGLQQPTDGLVRTLGREPSRRRRAVAHEIGVVFGQKSSLWWDLSVADNLEALRSLYRVPRPEHASRRELIVEGLNLQDVLARPIRQLSLGERVKCELAGALMHAPRLLVLDEPTIGLDIVSKRQLRRWLSSVAAEQGVAVLLTSHDTGDIAALCRGVTLIEQGRVALQGTVDDLRRAMDDRVSVTLTARERPLDDAELARLGEPRSWDRCEVEVSDDGSSITLTGPAARHDDLVRVALGIEPARHGIALETASPSLEDALLSRYNRIER